MLEPASPACGANETRCSRVVSDVGDSAQALSARPRVTARMGNAGKGRCIETPRRRVWSTRCERCVLTAFPAKCEQVRDGRLALWAPCCAPRVRDQQPLSIANRRNYVGVGKAEGDPQPVGGPGGITGASVVGDLARSAAISVHDVQLTAGTALRVGDPVAARRP